MLQLPLIALFTVSAALHGNGVIKTETRKVPEFHAIQVGGAFSIRLIQQDTTVVTLTGDENLIKLVEVRVENGTLHVSHPKEEVDTTKTMELMVGTPNLDALEIDGAAKLTAEKIRTRNLSLKVAGAAHAELSGVTDTLTVNSAGAANVDAAGLSSRKTTAIIQGAGRMVVHASDELVAEVSGVGAIEYVGNPKSVKRNVSGLGVIAPRK